MKRTATDIVVDASAYCGWEREIYQEWIFPKEVLEKWEEFSVNQGDRGIFVSEGWLRVWWNAFGRGRQLLIVVVKKRGAIKAIFPCCLQPLSGGGFGRTNIVSLTNSHTCYFDFLSDPDDREEALSYGLGVLSQAKPCAEITVTHVPAVATNGTPLSHLLRRMWFAVHVESQPWAPWAELSGEWDQFWEALPRKLRSSLKRCRKLAEEKGALEFEAVRQRQRLDELLDIMFEFEYRSWKGAAGSAIKSEANVEIFYRTLAHWAMQENRLFLFFLKLEGHPIAASMCLSSGETVFGIKLGHDASFGALSPGSLLQSEIFRYLYALPDISAYNLLGACDPWKMRWASLSGGASMIKVYPKSLMGWSRYICLHGWKIPLRWVRDHRPGVGSAGQSGGGEDAT